MRIEGIIAHHGQQYAYGPVRGAQGGKNPAAPEPVAGPEKTAPAAAAPGEAELEHSESTRGVIRLLLAGHFKGVADVRLRINFFEELSGIQAGKLQEAAGEKVPGLMESIQETVESLLTSGELQDDQVELLKKSLEGFTQSVNQALEDFQNSPTPDQEGLISGLNAAFKELTSNIAGLFQAGAPEPPAAEEPDTADPSGPAAPPVSTAEPPAPAPEGTQEATASAPELTPEAFLEQLTTVYEKALTSLLEGLDQADILPPLSESQGQGKAYAKFLAIYQNLAAGTGTAEDPEKGALVSATV